MGKPRTPAGRAKEIVLRLREEYPGTTVDLCELDFATPFQLLVATILSAQTTDVRVNLATPGLFAEYPDAESLAAADPGRVEQLISTIGLYRNKTKSIISMANDVVHRFDGEVPTSLEHLVSLAGVGRKTANVVRSVALGEPGLPVDTHVIRLSNRLGLTTNDDPVKIEHDLMPMVPRTDWGSISLRLILHGRRVCVARKPSCSDCILNDFCPSVQLPALPAPKAKRSQPTAAN